MNSLDVCYTLLNYLLLIVTKVLLLWGDGTQNDDTNQHIFSYVQKFIRDSGRFTKI